MNVNKLEDSLFPMEELFLLLLGWEETAKTVFTINKFQVFLIPMDCSLSVYRGMMWLFWKSTVERQDSFQAWGPALASTCKT